MVVRFYKQFAWQQMNGSYEPFIKRKITLCSVIMDVDYEIIIIPKKMNVPSVLTKVSSKATERSWLKNMREK